MHCIKPVLLFIFYLMHFNGYGQNAVKKYVQENTYRIQFIDPDSTDYSDLQPIASAVGDARIVMIGEQDHNDGPGYLSRVRLIKYLHAYKGFNVVAFESSFINVNQDLQAVKEKRLSMESFVQNDIYPSWAACQNRSPFFASYLPATLTSAHPINISGFDSYSNTLKTIPFLDSVLRQLNLPITQTDRYASEILPLLNNWYKYAGDTTTMDKIINYYEQIKGQLLDKVGRTNFLIMVIDNLITESKEYRTREKGHTLNFQDRNLRDLQMALNLRWLAEVQFPGEKIIVWAHNYHVSKYAGHYAEPFLNSAKPMSTVFTEDSMMLKQTYVIGFTSYGGIAGRLSEKAYKVSTPKANGFENWINHDYSYAFTDFKSFNIENPGYTEPFYMKCSLTSPFHRNELGLWTRIFDGVFFIRDTYRCSEK